MSARTGSSTGRQRAASVGCPGSFDVADSRYAGIGSSARTSPNNAEPTASRARARETAVPRRDSMSSASYSTPVYRLIAGSVGDVAAARRCDRSRDPATAESPNARRQPGRSAASADQLVDERWHAAAAAPGSSARPGEGGAVAADALGLRRRQQHDHDRKGYRAYLLEPYLYKDADHRRRRTCRRGSIPGDRSDAALARTHRAAHGHARAW